MASQRTVTVLTATDAGRCAPDAARLQSNAAGGRTFEGEVVSREELGGPTTPVEEPDDGVRQAVALDKVLGLPPTGGGS